MRKLQVGLVLAFALYGVLGVSLMTPASQDRAKGSASVEEIFQQYVAALGGEEALKKVTSRRMAGTVEYIGVGQRGTAPLEIYWEAPDKFYQVIRAPFGLIERGVNGSEGWGSHPQTGSRKLSPHEMLEARREWSLYQPLLIRDLYRKMRYEGRTRVDGQDFDVIAAETKQGRTERFYLDPSTHLPVRLELWEEGPEAVRAGELYLARFYLTDYRKLDGIAVPFRIRRVRPNSEAIYTFTEVAQNVRIDSKLFSPQRRGP